MSAETLNTKGEHSQALLDEQQFREQFREIWLRSLGGKIDDQAKTNEVTNLWKIVDGSVNLKYHLRNEDGDTLVAQYAKEIIKQYEESLRTRSKMGEGKRPPKSKRIHTRREKSRNPKL